MASSTSTAPSSLCGRHERLTQPSRVSMASGHNLMSSTEHVAGETLSAYVDGELDQQARSEVEQHVRWCAECQTTVDSYLLSRKMVRSLPNEPLPETFGRDLRRRLRRARRSEEGA
jgi:anti-sigma factor RsiW